MDSQKQSGSERQQLAELQVWDRVQQRLWRRDALVCVLLIGALLVAGLLGMPLVQSHVEKVALEEARRLVAAEMADREESLKQLRQEIRADTQYIKDQLMATQMEMQDQIQKAETLEATYAGLGDEAAEFSELQSEMRATIQRASNEESRMRKTRGDLNVELQRAEQTSERITKNLPLVMEGKLEQLEVLVERELDELRLLMADHMAGKPAMFSAYVDLDERTAKITGTNFGEKQGRVFMKVRVFRGGDKPVTESDSILVPLEGWGDDQIEVRLSTRVLDSVSEVKRIVTNDGRAKLRYGFMVQTADGRISQWSGNYVNSIIPPAHGDMEIASP